MAGPLRPLCVPVNIPKYMDTYPRPSPAAESSILTLPSTLTPRASITHVDNRRTGVPKKVGIK